VKTHYIVVSCIDYSPSTALINCGENKALAEELVAELNALVKSYKSQSPKPRSTDILAKWKAKRGFEALKEMVVLTDEYEVQEVVAI
jgi:hypothetical protein